MSFITRKKKLRFSVNFEIEELSSVSFVSGVLYCKSRLVDGGYFREFTERSQVQNHMVKWNATYRFQAKMTANASTGLLDDCFCKVSVRKEVKGGKSYEKLGFAKINLAEFAGSGKTSRRFILEGYTASQRQDNSVLKVNVDMVLVEGDPMFKVPTSGVSMSAGLEAQAFEQTIESKRSTLSKSTLRMNSTGSQNTLRMNSISDEDMAGGVPFDRLTSTTSSVPSERFSNITTGGIIGLEKDVLGGAASFRSKHRRTDSGSSSKSTDSDLRRVPSKLAMSRSSQNSTKSAAENDESVAKPGTVRSHADLKELIAEAGLSLTSGSEHKTIYCCEHDLVGKETLQPLPLDFGLDLSNSVLSRVEATAVIAEDVVDELLQTVDLTQDDSLETSGLQLFVGQDGSAIVSGSRRKGPVPAPRYQRVVVDKH